jgi:hypothetical protein
VTPAHIVPEWYFLPFYAILRAITFNIGPIDSKLGGVLAMFGSIAVLFVLPWLDTSKVRSAWRCCGGCGITGNPRLSGARRKGTEDMKKLLASIVPAAMALVIGAGSAFAAGYPINKPREVDWSFAGRSAPMTRAAAARSEGLCRSLFGLSLDEPCGVPHT